MNKKAIIGIGMLMIFIATILISSIAAGVLIRATGLLQERALQVEKAARERLVSGVELVGVYGSGNTTDETMSQFEFLMRLRAGSPPIQMRTLGLAFVSENISFSADLNTSKIGLSNCTFTNVTAETEYCIQPRLGDEDTILEEGELFGLLFKLQQSNALETERSIEVTFSPKEGALETLEFTTPQLVLSSKIRLR